MKTKFAGSRSHPIRHSGGFTLIELLVVIGIISILAAGIGISMREGSPTSALRAGQNSLVGLLSSARGQAALSQADSMIVVDVTPGSEECMRSLQVVVRTGATASVDQWRPVGDPIMLPQGIYIVPPSSSSITGITLTGSWTTKRQSSGFLTTTAGDLTERPPDTTYTTPVTNAFSGRKYIRFQVFSSLGTVGSAGTLLVSSGRRTSATDVTLDNPDFIRGVYLSRYGVPTFINETDSFDKL
jgi:prepilin-type N-terminal cleavage/methylation domain-containing protein